MSIEENYLIFDRGGAAYVVELGRGFNPPISIHIPVYFVVEYLVHWDDEVDILGVFLCLVDNYG